MDEVCDRGDTEEAWLSGEGFDLREGAGSRNVDLGAFSNRPKLSPVSKSKRSSVGVELVVAVAVADLPEVVCVVLLSSVASVGAEA